MLRKYILSFVVALTATCFLGYSSRVSAADSDAPTLLVVPSHYTSVQIVFDVAKLRRNILLVSYSEAGVKTGRSLYVWDGNAWAKTTFADYSAGSIFAVKPGRTVIIGSEKDVPPALGEVSTWCSNVKRIPTLSIKEVFNSLNETFNFSAPEWKWIAKEYDLTLEDKNAERRRYGKYGKPGAERARAPMPVAPTTVEPTAVIPGPVAPGPAAPAPRAPRVEKPSAPVVIQTEAPETNTKRSRPENK